MYVKLLSLYTLCEYDIVISYKTVKLQNLFYNYVFTSQYIGIAHYQKSPTGLVKLKT